MNHLIKQLKTAGEDFEFYPTTDEIIQKVAKDIKGSRHWHYGKSAYSLLDIGAGNGKVLLKLEDLAEVRELYAIERAEILRNSLDKKIGIVGTDFYEQSLIDKQIDITFCNPPYSQFVEWSTKIIRESSSNTVYLVIPERWTESGDIKKAIEYREAKVETLGDFTFLNAEDRTARARVQLLKIELASEKEDAFNRLFNEEFKNLRDKFRDEAGEETDKPTDKENEHKFKTLVTGKDYVHNLVEMYNTELANIRKNYETVGTLDAALLREFGIFPAKVRQCLKERIKGLKNLYWQELISRMDKITDRLTSKHRRKLLETAQKNAHVDFTESNIYAVILWILKNASTSIDEQLVETFEKMCSMANCKAYKSNTRPFEKDQWRYGQEKPSHIALEYRIVLHCCGRIENTFTSGKYRLSENGCEMLGDLLTIARGLGFICDTADYRLDRWNNEVWKPGEKQEFTFRKDKFSGTLLEVRAHLNGNIHLRMNQKFALALNVEYGRLKGWLKNGAEAAKELDDREAATFFKMNTLLPEAQFPLLFAPDKQTPPPMPEPEPETPVLTPEPDLTPYPIPEYNNPEPTEPDSITTDFLSLLTETAPC